MDFNLNFSSYKNDKKTAQIKEDILYDVIILGGGPSALTSAIYSMRKGMKTALISKDIGGQVVETSTIENYLGYTSVEGISLVQKFREHVEQFELDILLDYYVTKINDGKIKEIFCSNEKVYKSKSIIISTGKRWRKLGVEGEDEFLGKGVAYCAICDAPLFKNKEVAVVGGGNSAIEAVIDLAKIAKNVTIIQNLKNLTADKILLDKLEKFQNIRIITGHVVKSIKGSEFVEEVEIVNLDDNTIQTIKADGIFIEIGLIPNSEFVKDIVSLNQYSEIIVDCFCKTSAKGIFAAGDVTSVPYKQIIIASGEGAKAALSAYDYVLTEFDQYDK